MSQPTNDWAGLKVSQGRYWIRTVLGEGGMGFVYRALDQNLDADVVIKVPRRSMMDDPEFTTRFAREVRSLVRLAHPNIVKLTDVGEHDGVPFAVMQYLSGGNLEDYRAVDRNSATASANLAALGDWLPGVSAALDFVHAQGYVHRDVKPGNILFDAHGHVFLSDFGVAKALAAGPDSPRGRGQTALTGAGLVLGTPEYMAPELIMGQSFDGRIDQYALGATVYEMLSGRRPFEAATGTAVLVMQTTRTPVSLHQLDPRIPPALSEAVDRALAKDPARRFSTCSAFATAVLSAAATSHTVASAPRSPSGQSLRPDQVRLRCPRCDQKLVLPAALLSDLKSARGRRLSCPSCQVRLRIGEDGRTLVVSKTGASTPRPDQRRETPDPSPVEPGPSSQHIPTRTVAMSAPPRARSGTLIERVPTGNAPKPVESPPVRTRAPVWVRALACTIAVLLVTAGVAASRQLVPSFHGPTTGRLVVDAADLPPGTTVRLDGRPVDRVTFANPVALPPGGHVLEVIGEGYAAYRKALSIRAGQETAVSVLLKQVAPEGPPAHVVVRSAHEKPSKPTLEQVPAAPRPEPSGLVAHPSRVATPPKPERTVPPAPVRAIFQPVPDGVPVEDVTLASLLERPDAYGNRIVEPPGLYVLVNRGAPRADGTVSVSVVRVVLRARPNDLATLERVDSPTQIAIDQDLAQHLIDLNALHLGHSGASVNEERWGDTAAILTFHVQNRTKNGHDDWVPLLKSVEFLIGMNYLHIGEGRPRGSFKSIKVMSDHPQIMGVSNRHNWSEHIGVAYIMKLRHIVKNYKDIQFAAEAEQMNGMMSRWLGNMLRKGR